MKKIKNTQKRIKKPFRDPEKRFQTLIKNIPDVIWTTDHKGNTVFISLNIKKIYGYSQEEIYKGGDRLWLGRIHPDDIEKVKKAYKELFENRKRFDVEYRIKRKDGKWIWLHDRAVTIYKKDGALYADGVFSDITERKQVEEALGESEERYRTIVESVNFGVYRNTGGPHGKFLYANPAIAKMFGYGSVEEFMKVSVSSLYQSSENRKRFIEDILKTGFVKDKELQLRKKDSTPIVGSCTARIQYDKNNNIKWMDGVIEDVTEHKRIDQAKTEFVSLASHQLRTPLTGVKWFIELLLSEKAGKLSKKQKEYLKEIDNSNQRLIDLVNALLNVSRIELGVFGIEPKPISFIKIADSVLDGLGQEIKNKKLKIRKNYDKKLPIIKADPNLVRIIFHNLLSNAIKYTPEGGRVSLTIKKQKLNVLIKISDTGYGIPKNQQSEVFKKLFRADNIREVEPDGTGLGLYIVKAVVEQPGGKIWLKSGENKGTVFYVTIPLSGMKKKKGAKGLTPA